jgi:hypothetical protein
VQYVGASFTRNVQECNRVRELFLHGSWNLRATKTRRSGFLCESNI